MGPYGVMLGGFMCDVLEKRGTPHGDGVCLSVVDGGCMGYMA